MKANSLTRPSGTKAASAKLTLGKTTATAAREVNPYAARLLAMADESAAQRAKLGAPQGCATRAQWRAALLQRAHTRRVRDAARCALRIAQRRALQRATLARKVESGAESQALRERRERGTTDASATRRTRRAPSASDALRELIRAASAQRGYAETIARTRRYIAAHRAQWEARDAARAVALAYAPQVAKRAARRMSAEAREARDAQLTASERRVCAAIEAARRKGRVVTLAECDLQRARAKARRMRRARVAMLALLARKLRFVPLALVLMRAVCAARLARLRPVWRERSADAQAGRVAGQRARLQFLGSAALRATESGERIGRKVAREFAPANGTLALSLDNGAFTLDTRDGTGIPVDAQAREEMRLAARAELLAGNGWKEANREAGREVRRALKEPSYASADLATRARDRAAQRASDAWQGEECEPNAQQPHAAEFLAGNDSEANQSALAVVFTKRRVAADALLAYWAAKDNSNARSECARDLRTLRQWGAQVLSGTRTLADCSWSARCKDKANEAAEKKARRFAKRVEEGSALLADDTRRADDRESITPALCEARRERAAREAQRAPLWILARGKAESLRADWCLAFRAGRFPLAARLLQSGSATNAQRAEGRAAQRTRSNARAAQTMRAPLAPGARAALDALATS